MKNKDKFVKIANIISKVLIGIMIALLVLCVCVVCFRACSAVKHVAYANTRANVTDLTGTTWKWKETLSGNFVANYSIDFISDSVSFNEIIFDQGPYVTYVSVSGSDDLEAFVDGSWFDETARTISITGGTDATNTELINYLYANAIYQGGSTPEPVESYNLYVQLTNGVDKTLTIDSSAPLSVQLDPQSGYGYPTSVSVVNAILDSYNAETGVAVISKPTANCYVSGVCPVVVQPDNVVRGRYVFKNQVDLSAGTWTGQSVNFSLTLSNGETANFVRLRAGSVQNGFALWYGRSSVNGTISDTIAYSSVASSNSDAGWFSPVYQSIDFGATPQTVSTAFYSWLVANTVLSGVNADSYNIGYNAGLAVGQTSGYSSGYTAGQSYGYNQGYQAGLAEGQNSALHGAEGVIAGTAGLFDIKIFGAFSILDMLLVVFGIGVAIWFLKMFAGG